MAKTANKLHISILLCNIIVKLNTSSHLALHSSGDDVEILGKEDLEIPSATSATVVDSACSVSISKKKINFIIYSKVNLF